LTEKWLCENTVISILDYVEYFMHKFTRACEIEHGNLKQSKAKMKQWYDKDTMKRYIVLPNCYFSLKFDNDQKK
jgi:hypothetical protein